LQAIHFEGGTEPMRMSKFLRYWTPVLVWLVLIFIGSTDLMSAEHTSRIIGPILRWLHPAISPRTIGQVQIIVRKTAHITEYAVLAMLCFRAITMTLWPNRAVLVAAIVLSCCAFFAASDEFHQSFVPSRTASLRDVVIDICGGAIGVVLYWLFRQRKLSKRASARIN
jgi:VanZ family protein